MQHHFHKIFTCVYSDLLSPYKCTWPPIIWLNNVEQDIEINRCEIAKPTVNYLDSTECKWESRDEEHKFQGLLLCGYYIEWKERLREDFITADENASCN